MLKGSHRSTPNVKARHGGGRHAQQAAPATSPRAAASQSTPSRSGTSHRAHRAAAPAPARSRHTAGGHTRRAERTRRARRAGRRSVVAGIAAGLTVAAASTVGIVWSSAQSATAEPTAQQSPAVGTDRFIAASAVLSSGSGSVDFNRDSFGAQAAPPVPLLVPGTPAAAQQAAAQLVKEAGWGAEQFQCLVTMWNHESGWRVSAANPSSDAFGIPQALPGSKMAAYGDDWRTNPVTQIKWGLAYIEGRYGSPCGAWSFWRANRWY